jgi:hypothetical protein
VPTGGDGGVADGGSSGGAGGAADAGTGGVGGGGDGAGGTGPGAGGAGAGGAGVDGSAGPDGPSGAGGSGIPAWTAPAKLEDDDLYHELAATLAVDPVAGDAVAVFVEKQAQVRAMRYDAGADKWSGPVLVASGQRMGDAQVGMDTDGHVLVVWTEGGVGVKESHSGDRGATWSAATLLHASESASKPSLAVGRHNRARAAWDENPGSGHVMLTAYWDGASWSAAAMPLGSQDIFSTRKASIAVDAAGAGWIAWGQPAPDSTKASAHLYVAHFTGAALEPPQFLDRDALSVQPPPVLAMAADGRAAAVLWQQNYTGGNDLFVSVWSAAGGWGAPEKAVVGGGELPAIVIDTGGAVTVAYQTILDGGRNVAAVRREPGMGWLSPMALEHDNTSPGGAGVEEGQPSPVATVDGAGNVQVAWRKGHDPTSYGLAARRFVPGQTWQPEATIAARPNLIASWPLALGTTDAGRSLLVWVYQPSDVTMPGPDAYELWAAFFR